MVIHILKSSLTVVRRRPVVVWTTVAGGKSMKTSCSDSVHAIIFRGDQKGRSSLRYLYDTLCHYATVQWLNSDKQSQSVVISFTFTPKTIFVFGQYLLAHASWVLLYTTLIFVSSFCGRLWFYHWILDMCAHKKSDRENR